MKTPSHIIIIVVNIHLFAFLDYLHLSACSLWTLLLTRVFNLLDVHLEILLLVFRHVSLSLALAHWDSVAWSLLWLFFIQLLLVALLDLLDIEDFLS